MADEDLSLNEDQLLDNLDDANGDLLNEVDLIKHSSVWFTYKFHIVAGGLWYAN